MPISAGLQTRHKNAQLIKCIPDDAPIRNSYKSYTRSSLHVNIDLAKAIFYINKHIWTIQTILQE